MKAQGLQWSIQLHAPAALIQDKYSRLTLNTNVGGGPSPSGRFEEDRTLLLLSGIEPRFLGCPVRSPVAVHAELSRPRKEAEVISSNMLSRDLLRWTPEMSERRAEQPDLLPRFGVGGIPRCEVRTLHPGT